MDETIVIPKFRLTPEDVSGIRTLRGLRVAVAISVLCALAIIGALWLMDMPKSNAITTALIAAPVCFVTLLLRSKALTQKPGNQVHLLEREIVLSQANFTQTVDGGLTTIAPWTMISKIEDRPTHFFIYFTEVQYFSIPRRVLTPELDRQVLTFFYQKGLLKPKTR